MLDRRDVMRIAVLGGAVYISGLGKGMARSGASKADDFYFLQMTDTHWGYEGAANPHADVTLPKAVEIVNGLSQKPDFIIFTGDLTHTTDDPAERRRRMAEFQEIVQKLGVKQLRFIPGEHDASLDEGAAFQEFFGPSFYSFDHKGVHFIALDNVSDPEGRIGQVQLDWLKTDVARYSPEQKIIVFAHRPLFSLYPNWDWFTVDGQSVLDVLMPYQDVSVFYGHIHQAHEHQTGHILHRSSRSLIFPLPAPGSAPKRKPLPWSESAEDHGIGFATADYERKDQTLKIITHNV